MALFRTSTSRPFLSAIYRNTRTAGKTCIRHVTSFNSLHKLQETPQPSLSDSATSKSLDLENAKGEDTRGIKRHKFRQNNTQAKKDRLIKEGNFEWRLEEESRSGFVRHDVERLRKEQPKKYQLFLREKEEKLRNLEETIEKTRHDRVLSAEAILTHGRLKYSLENMVHKDGIEKMLGYTFKSYKDLMAFLPRFPRFLAKDRREDRLKTDSLWLLGKSVICLAGLELTKKDPDKPQLLDIYAEKMGLDHFIIGGEDEPLTRKQLNLNQENSTAENQTGSYRYMALTKLFGAIYKDGGMNGVKEAISHTTAQFPPFNENTSDLSRSEIMRLTGIYASNVLFANSLKGETVGKQFSEHMHTRCGEDWHLAIANKHLVHEFIQSYLTESVKTGDRDMILGKDYGTLRELSPAQRYPVFLGTIYYHGGLDLVAYMLNSHDPGYDCPLYLQDVRKQMIELDAKNATFWKV